MVKKILFICKYNAFRSKVAEFYFNKNNKNKKLTSISRGFIMGGKPDKTQIKFAKKFGAEIKGKQNPVSLKDLKDAYKIIVVANDIPKIMFNYQLVDFNKKMEIWGVKDEQKQNPKNAEKIVKKIIKKVKNLIDKESKNEKRNS